MRTTIIRRFAVLSFALAAFSLQSCDTTDATEPNYEDESIVSNEMLDDTAGCIPPPIHFKDTLGLTADQLSALKSADDSLRKAERLELESATSREEARAIMEKYRAAHKAALESILTAEQLALLETLKPPFRDRGRHGHPGGRPGNRFGSPEARDSAVVVKLTTELGLSADQVAQVEALQAKMRSDRPENPKQAFYDGLKVILTADQLAKLDAMIDTFPPPHHRPNGPRRRR